jgi:hypothetical protein
MGHNSSRFKELLDIHWSAPVLADLPNGTTRIFYTLDDAHEFLERHWPAGPSEDFALALILCRSAIMRLLSPEAAREAFIAACIQAGLLHK